MHKQVRQFCQSIKLQFPLHFNNINVLDCGSLDINGNNRWIFDQCNYFGIDIAKGPNVDQVTRVHDFKPRVLFDTVISTEMLEHDECFPDTLESMFSFLKPGGLLLLTAAGFGRKEHGTANVNPHDSPMTPDYYCNISVTMLLQGLDLTKFSWYMISFFKTDIRFAGIKI